MEPTIREEPKALTLLENIRLGWKWFAATNIQA
jgi:hypothetical protein